jgi:hypothetical protein
MPLVNKKAYSLAILNKCLNVKSPAYFPQKRGSNFAGIYDFTVIPDCFGNFTHYTIPKDFHAEEYSHLKG